MSQINKPKDSRMSKAAVNQRNFVGTVSHHVLNSKLVHISGYYKFRIDETDEKKVVSYRLSNVPEISSKTRKLEEVDRIRNVLVDLMNELKGKKTRMLIRNFNKMRTMIQNQIRIIGLIKKKIQQA